MEAGKLRHRVTIQRNDQAQDPTTGAMYDYWLPVASVWASVEPLSAKEFIASRSQQSEVSARVVIRARNDLDASMRIVHNGTTYGIVGILRDKDSGLEYMTIPVTVLENA
jgi:SPP1 family predicted phage head-tail adaptor